MANEHGENRGVNRPRRALALLCLFAAALWSDVVGAQDAFFYPSRGQTPQQQQQDRQACHEWAVQQVGFDPGRAPAPAAPLPPPPPPQQQGQVLRGAGRGAAVGAVGGAIGGDAGKGAAIGAATGALIGGFRRRDQARQQEAYQQQYAAAQSQQAAAMNSQNALYTRALGACMQGRGYATGTN